MRLKLGLLVLVPLLGIAQAIKQDSVFRITITDKVAESPKEVLAETNVLLAHATSTEDSIHALLLQSRAYQQFGVRDEAVASLKKAHFLAKAQRLPKYQVVTNLRLSTILRESGFLSLSKTYLSEVIRALPTIKTKDLRLELDYYIHLEQAHHAYLAKNTEEAVALLRESQLYVRELSFVDQRVYLHANSDRLIAMNYIEEKRYKEAEQLLSLALRSLSSTTYKETPLRGAIYTDMARTPSV